MKSKDDMVIVSIDNYSLKVLMDQGFYATAIKFKKDVKYVAFYECAPISAITRYGKIKEIKTGNKLDVGVIYWMRNFPERDPPYIIITFDSIKKLKKNIKRDTAQGIQNPVYASFEKLTKSSTLNELY